MAANFSTDLHSIGQYIQDGLRCFFETVLWVKTPKSAAVVPFDAQDEDGLNFLAEKEIHFVNSKAFAGTMLAHMDGGVPNLVIALDKMDAYHFGALVYFFEKAVGISGYLLDVNPFDQPGLRRIRKICLRFWANRATRTEGRHLKKDCKTKMQWLRSRMVPQFVKINRNLLLLRHTNC